MRTESSTKRGRRCACSTTNRLVGPLQQLVDRRVHRAFDDVDEIDRVHGLVGADKQGAWPRWLCVASERARGWLDVLLPEAGFQQPLGGAAAHKPLGARARVDAGRLDADDAPGACGDGSGDADQRHHLLRGEPGDGSLAANRPQRANRHLARRADCRSTMRLAMCSASSSTSSASSATTPSIAPSKSSGKARHVDALLVGGEIDGAVDGHGHHRLGSRCRCARPSRHRCRQPS